MQRTAGSLRRESRGMRPCARYHPSALLAAMRSDGDPSVASVVYVCLCRLFCWFLRRWNEEMAAPGSSEPSLVPRGPRGDVSRVLVSSAARGASSEAIALTGLVPLSRGSRIPRPAVARRTWRWDGDISGGKWYGEDFICHKSIM